jgi:hypothetical protein
MPADCLEVLASLVEEFNVAKAGLALANDRPPLVYAGIYHCGKSITDFEAQYWTRPRPSTKHPNLEIYDSGIDTTFAVYDKSRFSGGYEAVRVAGKFTCKHLPWYPAHNHASFTREDIEAMYGKGCICSTTGKMILRDKFYDGAY